MPVTLVSTSKGQTGQGSILSIGSVSGTVGTETFIPIGELVDTDFDGGSKTINDASHMLAAAKIKVAGLLDEGKVTITCNRLVTGSDAGVAAVLAAWHSQSAYDFQFVLGENVAAAQTTTGDTRKFSAIVSSGPKESYNVDKIVQISFGLEICGVLTETVGS